MQNILVYALRLCVCRIKGDQNDSANPKSKAAEKKGYEREVDRQAKENVELLNTRKVETSL